MRFSILSALLFSVPALATFSSPKGGEKWNVGQEQTISWDTNGLEGLIDIKLVPGGATDTTIIITEIATQVENKGSIKWTPDRNIKTTDVTIIIIDSKQTKSSSELFILIVDIQTVQSNSNNNNNYNNNNYNNNDNYKGEGKGDGKGSNGKDSNGNNYGGNNNYENGNGKGTENNNNNYNNGSKDDGKNNTKSYESKSEDSKTKSNEYNNNGGKSTKSEEQKMTMTKSEDNKMTKTKSEESKMTTTAMKESKAETIVTASHAMTTAAETKTKTKAESAALTTPEVISTFTPNPSLVVLTPLVSEITKATETKAEKTTKTTSQGSTITNQIFITETAGQGLTTFRASTTAAQAVNGTRAIQASGTGTGGSGQQFFGAASSVGVPGTIVGGFFGLLSMLFL